jgi:DNA ligase-associated metallophosphoesterase
MYWEEERTLILADIHIGKAAMFRKAGVAVPEGSMQEDLLKISALIEQMQAKKCIIVGDLIHAPSGLSAEVKAYFSQWLKQTSCEIHLILGNHDRILAKSLPEEWSLYLHKEPIIINPFYFSHYPMKHEEYFVWSGHLHPKITIKNQHDSITLRCFQIFPELGILPAFGSFVGGTAVKKEKNCSIYAITDQSVIEI